MRTDIETMIRNELMALTRVGWTYHPPVFDDEGKFRLGFPDYEANLKINKRFYDAGVRIFLSNLPLGWVDEDKYCFDSMDETLGKLFSVVPDAYYIPRLRLDPPFAWMKKQISMLMLNQSQISFLRVSPSFMYTSAILSISFCP